VSTGEHTWGDFQSLIQLSVALNGAFAAFASFFGSGLQKEERLLHYLLEECGDATLPRVGELSFGARVRLLQGERLQFERQFDFFINVVARYSCLVVALIGIVLLVYSSYRYKLPINASEAATCSALLLPFVVGSMYSIYLSVRLHRSVSLPRRQVENALIEARGA
jgi:hypothetical protein